MLNIRSLIPTLILFAVLISGCRQEPEQFVERDFISFTKPHGWLMQDITHEGDEHEGLLLRKQGMFASGFITITYTRQQPNPQDWLVEHRDLMNEQDAFSFSDDNFKLTGPAQYGIYQSESAEFTQVYFGAEYIGEVYAINNNGYSVLILQAGSVPDREMNEAGFEIVRESLQIGKAAE